MFKAASRQRFPRTFDEAFRTPAWFDPVEGPYKRGAQAAHPHSHWVVLAVVLLALCLALAMGGAA